MTRYEVIAAALEKMREAHNRKRALVVITNHTDTSAEETQDFNSVLTRITQFEIPVYVFGFDPPYERMDRSSSIIQLAAESGGVFFPYSAKAAAPQTARNLEADIRGQYAIRY